MPSEQSDRHLQLQLPQLLHVRAAGAEDVADIGAAGQVTHAEPQQPALELEILAHAADPLPCRDSSPLGRRSRRRQASAGGCIARKCPISVDKFP